ncbi:MAG: hypothetical protein J7L62_03990, partial [Candidatus Aminicenantes bacterium]|nr:hypothetical protein [Candidatus Aminicenantes bacterium]
EYEGRSVLKEHFDYLRRAKIGYYLPCYELKECPKLEPEKDPRRQEAKPTEEMIKKAKKEIVEIAEKNPDFVVWRGFIDLSEKIPQIENEVISQVEEYIKSKGGSATTEELVERILGKKKETPEFGRWCIALNKKLESKKLTFVLVSKKGYGKWNTWLNLVTLEKDLPIKVRKKLPVFLSRSNIEVEANIREFEKEEKRKESRNKHILTWREVLSGGVRVRKGYRNLLKGEMELEGRDGSRTYTLFYFPEKNYILGLGKYYRENFVVQSAQLFMEWEGDHFKLSLRKEKKPFHAPMLVYEPEGDKFVLKDAEISSEIDVDKRAFISRVELKEITERLEEFRKIPDLTALLREIFKSFGEAEKSFRIHYLKVCHIADLINGIPSEDVIKSLLGNEEFVADEEFGYFFLDLNKASEIPIQKEETPEEERIKGFEKLIEKMDKEEEIEEKPWVPKKKRKFKKKKPPRVPKNGFFAEKLKEALDKNEEE